jgi:hypothetical protein
LEVNDKAKAYPVDLVKQRGVVEDVFEDTTFMLSYDKALDVVRIYKKFPDGRTERVNPFSSFWFAWAVTHPGTELYQ